MPLDVNVFDKLKSFQDYQKAEDEFQLKKQLGNAQLLAAQAQLAKAGEVDADKLGEQAFLKAAQGMPLSPQETAALKYIDAKSPTSAFNPVTGNLEVKPSLLDRAGLGTGAAPATSPSAQAPRSVPQGVPSTGPTDNQFNALFEPQTDAPIAGSEEVNEWDIAFQKELENARGNPRLQQSIRDNYAKAKISMTEAEAKSAGFADRMGSSNPIIDETANDSMNAWERTKGSIPLVGNFLVSDGYQSATQAQKDFLNSILRRESGAVISPSEFKNGTDQYFPMPGDSEDVLAQKAANRESALKGIQRSAGPAYKPTVVKPVSKSKESGIKNGTIADNPETGESKVYMDGAWKPWKGKK